MGVVDDLDRAREAYERGDWAPAYDRLVRGRPAARARPTSTTWPPRPSCSASARRRVGALQRAYRLHAAGGRRAGPLGARLPAGDVFSTPGEPAMGAAGRPGRSACSTRSGDAVERGYVDLRDVRPSRPGRASRGGAPTSVTAHGRRFATRTWWRWAWPPRAGSRSTPGGCRGPGAASTRRWPGDAAGEVSPVFAGHVYCTMIEGCQEISDFGRAAEWTAALDRWCEGSPAWCLHRPVRRAPRPDLAPARRLRRGRRGVRRRGRALPLEADAGRRRALGAERGDVLRCWATSTPPRRPTSGRPTTATTPSPGWPCCGWRRAAPAAVAAVRRLLDERPDPVGRSRLLPAAVEVLLAGDDVRTGARGAPSWTGSPRTSARRCRDGGLRAARSSSRPATRPGRCPTCARRAAVGPASTRRTRQRADPGPDGRALRRSATRSRAAS